MKIKGDKFVIIMLIILISVFIALGVYYTRTEARTFTEAQDKRAKAIGSICINEWDKYGVLPSVCIAQAFVESTLGENCKDYNLWGIRSGHASYDSLEEGVYAYLEVINNGYYDKAPFTRDASLQIQRILDGGYCEPVGDYYDDVMRTIDHYDLHLYDEILFRRLEDKERREKQKDPFDIEYDKEIPGGVVITDSSIITGGAVCIYVDHELHGIYDVKPGATGNVLRVSDKRLVGKDFDLYIYENAKG